MHSLGAPWGLSEIRNQDSNQTKFHFSSLKSKKSWGKMCTVGFLCALCAPLCNPCATHSETCCLTTVLLIYLKLLWDTAPHDQNDTAPPDSKDTAPHSKKMLKGYCSTIFFWHFCRALPFFQQARRQGSDQNFFLPRVPKFKLDHLS